MKNTSNWAPVVTYQYHWGKVQGCGNKVNCFLRREILFIWNHSFGSQIRLRMYFRASITLWFLDGPAHQKRGNSFLKREILFHLESLIWVSYKAENASQSIYNPLASRGRPPDPGADGPAHQEKGKKGKLFSQNRNTFYLESVILGSDKAENVSQSIYNPLASGGPHTHGRKFLIGSAPLADGPVRQWHTDLDTFHP